MKKHIILLLAITSMLVFALTGCSSDGNFTARTYSSDGNKIEDITIDVIDREIAVSVSEDNQVHIDYYESEKEYYDISVAENNILKMKLSKSTEWQDYIGTKPAKEYRKINLKIPHALLSSLSITTTNEAIRVSPMAVTDSVSLSSNGGNIEFEQIAVNKALTLTAKNGNIKGTILGSYDAFSIACEIKKGECNLPLQKTEGEKSLKVTCNNGNIRINFVVAQ